LELNGKSGECLRNSGELVETVVDDIADEILELGCVERVLLSEGLKSREDIIHDGSEGDTERLGSVGKDSFLGEVGLGIIEISLRLPNSIVLS